MASSRRASTVRIQVGHRVVSGVGLTRDRFRDIYHHCLSASWPRLVLGYFAVFALINLLFTALHLLDPLAVSGAHPPRPLDVLFFSVEVFGTVSFGGFQPGSTYGHALASVEILCGIVSYAFVTGLSFARFTRVTAELVFARHPVITEHDGRPTLITRVANKRHNFLTDAQAKLWVVMNERRDGRVVARRSIRARLLREDNPLLVLSWLLYHAIDEHSPLHGMTTADLELHDVSLIYRGRRSRCC